MDKNRKNGYDSFKVMILGEAGVGKTSLVKRYTQGKFSPETTTTVGVDRVPIKIKVDNELINFQVLDTAGCFGFQSLIKSYVNNVDAVIFVYDLTNKETFACLPLWNSLMNNIKSRNIVQILVGNKRDLSEHREVQFKNAKHYAEFEGMVAMEVSVKEEDSVELVFESLARELLIRRENESQSNEIPRDVNKRTVALPPRPKSADILEKEQEPFSHLARKFRFLFKNTKSVTGSKSETSLSSPSLPVRTDIKTIKTDYFRWF